MAIKGGFDRCRGCDLRPTTLNTESGYCEPCGVKRDEFAKAALTGLIIKGVDVAMHVIYAFQIADEAMVRRGTP